MILASFVRNAVVMKRPNKVFFKCQENNLLLACEIRFNLLFVIAMPYFTFKVGVPKLLGGMATLLQSFSGLHNSYKIFKLFFPESGVPPKFRKWGRGLDQKLKYISYLARTLYKLV